MKLEYLEPPVVELKGVSFFYNGTAILDSVDLRVEKGQFVSVVGLSGSGKSTLLRLIARLERPYEGEVSVNSSSVGVVFQDYSLFPWFSLLDNIVVALEEKYPKHFRPQLVDLARRYLKMVGLESSERKLPKELSGGMRQRGAIARMLALGSNLFLMDEPFGALDAGNRKGLQELFSQLTSEDSKTVVFVTHDIEEALLLSDRVVVLAGAPASVQVTIDVPFERPRSMSRVLADSRFARLRRDLFGIINDLNAKDQEEIFQCGGGV